MNETRRIQLPIDDSDAARAAVAHVAATYAHSGAEIRLFHVVGRASCRWLRERYHQHLRDAFGKRASEIRVEYVGE